LTKLNKKQVGEVKITLNSEDVLAPKPHNQDFECGICLGIVFKPMRCGNCSRLLC